MGPVVERMRARAVVSQWWRPELGRLVSPCPWVFLCERRGEPNRRHRVSQLHNSGKNWSVVLVVVGIGLGGSGWSCRRRRRRDTQGILSPCVILQPVCGQSSVPLLVSGTSDQRQLDDGRERVDNLLTGHVVSFSDLIPWEQLFACLGDVDDEIRRVVLRR